MVMLTFSRLRICLILSRLLECVVICANLELQHELQLTLFRLHLEFELGFYHMVPIGNIID
jgi:hypothetical protein